MKRQFFANQEITQKLNRSVSAINSRQHRSAVYTLEKSAGPRHWSRFVLTPLVWSAGATAAAPIRLSISLPLVYNTYTFDYPVMVLDCSFDRLVDISWGGWPPRGYHVPDPWFYQLIEVDGELAFRDRQKFKKKLTTFLFPLAAAACKALP